MLQFSFKLKVPYNTCRIVDRCEMNCTWYVQAMNYTIIFGDQNQSNQDTIAVKQWYWCDREQDT
jgi:hypothetical protein